MMNMKWICIWFGYEYEKDRDKAKGIEFEVDDMHMRPDGLGGSMMEGGGTACG